MEIDNLPPKLYKALLDSLLPAERELVWFVHGRNSALKDAAKICSEAEPSGHAELAESILKLCLPDPLPGFVGGRT